MDGQITAERLAARPVGIGHRGQANAPGTPNRRDVTALREPPASDQADGELSGGLLQRLETA